MEIWTGDFINIIHKIYILKIFLTRTYKTHFYKRIIEKTGELWFTYMVCKEMRKPWMV